MFAGIKHHFSPKLFRGSSSNPLRKIRVEVEVRRVLGMGGVGYDAYACVVGSKHRRNGRCAIATDRTPTKSAKRALAMLAKKIK